MCRHQSPGLLLILKKRSESDDHEERSSIIKERLLSIISKQIYADTTITGKSEFNFRSVKANQVK